MWRRLGFGCFCFCVLSGLSCVVGVFEEVGLGYHVFWTVLKEGGVQTDTQNIHDVNGRLWLAGWLAGRHRRSRFNE